MRPVAERDMMLTCKEEPEAGCHIEDLPFMSTTEMYLCCWNQPPLSPLRETSPKKEEEVASEWTPHVVHDMLIVCKPNLYPIFKVPGCGFEPPPPLPSLRTFTQLLDYSNILGQFSWLLDEISLKRDRTRVKTRIPKVARESSCFRLGGRCLCATFHNRH